MIWALLSRDNNICHHAFVQDLSFRCRIQRIWCKVGKKRKRWFEGSQAQQANEQFSKCLAPKLDCAAVWFQVAWKVLTGGITEWRRAHSESADTPTSRVRRGDYYDGLWVVWQLLCIPENGVQSGGILYYCDVINCVKVDCHSVLHIPQITLGQKDESVSSQSRWRPWWEETKNQETNNKPLVTVRKNIGV